MTPKAVLIAGPTASGKSALAMDIAEALDGVVVNADSQQVYREWRVLTARPSEADETRLPHRLYGHIPLDAAYSVGHWLRDLEGVLSEPRVPVIVGGTGLYFKGLTEGLAPIPEVPPEDRAEAEEDLDRLGLEGLVAALQQEDPGTAANIDLSNPRRVLRAWEVLRSSGTGLATWQAETPPPRLALSDVMAIVLEPPREWLYARCDARFDQMILDGALDEVRAVMAHDMPAAAPGLRALGAPELMAHLQGEVPLYEAIETAKMETRRYAKRQSTWMRNQMGSWHRIDSSQPGAAGRAIAQIKQEI